MRLPLAALGAVSLFAGMTVAAAPSAAQPPGGPPHGGPPPPPRGAPPPRGGWQGDIRHFQGHDSAYWRSGRWWHGAHGGRTGWWWILGSTWYFYPAPVYPYPNPYAPPSIRAPAPGVWHYCSNPRGYYPYVPQCYGHWRAVPAR